MKIAVIKVGSLATNCYAVVDGEDCLVIDPGDRGPSILRRVKGLGAGISGIVLTHGHFDHTGAVGYIREQTGAKVMIGEDDAGLLVDPGWMRPFMDSGSAPITDVVFLRDGDTVTCGTTEFTVYHTPGHSPGSICLYTPGHLFSGDLVFMEGVGRTDLPGGDPSKLAESLRRMLSTLPDETKIYPGHGGTTTVAHEKAANPFF